MKKIIITIMAILTIMSLVSCSKKEPEEQIIGKVWFVGSTGATITVLNGDNKYEKEIEPNCTKDEYDAVMAAYDSGVIDERYAFDMLFADQLTNYSK